MNVNSTAVVFWVFAALIGYIIDNGQGAAVGAACAIVFSFLLNLL